jgi:polyisoprenoid-binding protein YceI
VTGSGGSSWTVVPARSSVRIEARSSLHPIHGEGRDLSGTIEASVVDGQVDLSTPPKGRVELPLRTLASGNALYDRELQRRIDTKTYPTAVVELVRTSGAANDQRMHLGLELTFHGVTRPFEEDVTVSLPEDGTLVVEGEHTFDVRDYGIQPPRILTLRVYPEVTVRARIVAERPG